MKQMLIDAVIATIILSTAGFAILYFIVKINECLNNPVCW